jgi:hypothetical protein
MPSRLDPPRPGNLRRRRGAALPAGDLGAPEVALGTLCPVLVAGALLTIGTSRFRRENT